MAQNITLLGASYSDVPAVTLPKTGGGTAQFDDTSDATAAASDIATGKTAYVNGEKITGTNSGGGGSTRFVTGTFTGTTEGAAMTVTVPYTGSSYPIAVIIRPTDGAYNSSTEIYNLIQRYALVEWVMTKAIPGTAPTYSTSGSANYGVTAGIYKNSTSSATQYTRTSAMNTNSFSSSAATAAVATACRVRSATQLSVFIASSSYGFVAGVEYTYEIIYSE